MAIDSFKASLDSASSAKLAAPRPTFLSIIINDPLLQLKATPAVSARRAHMTKIVKGILTGVALVGVIGLFRVTFASASEAPQHTAVESNWDADRVVRGVETVTAKAPPRRDALKADPRGTKASLTRSTFHRNGKR